jgi:hypothetical protein
VRHVLAIDGGGVRGVLPASFLATVEEQIDGNVVDYFDLIVGTSTGGIIALGLGAGLSPAEIRDFYLERGARIFSGISWLRKARHVATAKYDQQQLRTELNEILGERKLGESRTRLVIPSMDVNSGKVHLWKTAHNERFVQDYTARMVDVAMATSAAPTYFQAFLTDAGVPLIDGGVFANNPAGLAAVEAVGVLGWPRDEVAILSLGCGAEALDIRTRGWWRSGLVGLAPKLSSVFLTAQSDASCGMAIKCVIASRASKPSKITYRTPGDVNQHIQDFRTDPRFRIAVSVDQIATGTDIRPIECLVFMRMVRSRSLFEQMKGRGVRRIDPDDLQAVTSDNRDKDHFVIVDCVGITDEDRAWAETKPLDREPAVPLKSLLQRVAEGSRKAETLTTVASRLTRLHHKLADEQHEELKEKTGGKTLIAIATELLQATDKDNLVQLARDRAALKEDETPTDEQVAEVADELIAEAVKPLLVADVRRTIEDLQVKSEQVLDIISRDKVLRAEFVDTGEAARAVQTFKEFIDQHHDEYVALKFYFERPYDHRPSLEDIKKLAEAIKSPPANLTPAKLWAAYQRVESSKVRGSGGQVLTDIVSLIRFAVGADNELVPHEEVVKLRFDLWLQEQQQGGQQFTPEQLRWLEMIRDHIATSLSIEPDDFDLEPFSQEGGLVAAYEVFGEKLNPILDELNEELAAV